MNKLQYIWVYIKLILAMLFWSLSFIWYKDVYHFLSPFTTILFRLIISGVILFVFAFSTKQLQPVKKADFKLFLLLALSEPFLYFVGESLGMQYITPTIAAVMVALIPLFVPVLAFFVLKEQIIKKNIVGIIISFVGVILVILNKNLELNASLKGILLMTVAVIAAVFYPIILRKLATQYNPLTLIAWQNSIGAIMFLPLTLMFEFKNLSSIHLSAGMLVPLLSLSIFASSFAFLFYTSSIKKLGAFKANIFTNTIPVFTAIFSYFLMQERLQTQHIFGIVLVVSGLVLSQYKSIKRRPADNA